MDYIKYKVVNTESLTVRKKPSLKGEVFSYLSKGQKVNGVRGKYKKKDGVTWRQIILKNTPVWVSQKYLQRITPNYRKLVLEKAKLVYQTIIKVGAKHESGAHSLDEIKSKKKTTCATAVSAALQEAGVLRKGKILSHTSAVGSSSAVKKKNTKKKAISGYKHLKEGTFKCYKIGKTWKNVPKKYKKPGAVAIYDSNIAIYAGDFFYTANNGSSQKDGKGRYKKNTAKSGYCYNSPVLYIIIPNN